MSTIAQDALDALTAGAKGAGAGMVLGPLGAAVGGLAGLASSLVPHVFGVDAEPALSAVAQAITGQTNTADQMQVLSTDPVAVAQFKIQAMQIAADREQAQIDAQTSDITAWMANVADARRRDVQVRQVDAGRNTRADVMLTITVGGIVACLAVSILGKLDGNSAIFGLVAGLVGVFSKCFADAFSFEFGSSRGSQMKDGTIADLARNPLPEKVNQKPAATVNIAQNN